jgi:hypothetical protein
MGPWNCRSSASLPNEDRIKMLLKATEVLIDWLLDVHTPRDLIGTFIQKQGASIYGRFMSHSPTTK